MAAHLDRIDELVLAMEAVGEQMDEARQLVILLDSMPSEFDTLVSIIENTLNPQLMDVKAKLLKEEEKSKTKESTETAFKAHAVARRVNCTKQRGVQKKKLQHGSFNAKCFVCGKTGHKAADCYQRSKREREELTFVAGDRTSDGWLFDSGAASHMSPVRTDFTTLKPIGKTIKIKIADGATVTAAGVGDVDLL